jgi:rfaE bifunctional protein kinase chain/domain
MNPDSELSKILSDFRLKNVLIIGDVMVDEYLWGKVTRISPEAPVPIVSCRKREYRMGGAANVALNIKGLEAEPVLCSVIGDDEEGRTFIRLMKENGMDIRGISKSSGRRTTVKTRVIGDHQHLLRVDHENTDPLSESEESGLIRGINELITSREFQAIVFQDYDKGVITNTIIQDITQLAGEVNIPVLVDPKKRNFHQYKGVNLFKPNFKEFTEGLNLQISKSDHEGIYTAASEMLSSNDIKDIMITLSEKGIFMCNGSGYSVIPAEERDVADVSGAGDTVIAVASLGYACGLDLKEIAALSNLAGGLVCEKAGVVPITHELFQNYGGNLRM